MNDPNPMIQIETTLGEIILELDREKAPVSVENFIGYDPNEPIDPENVVDGVEGLSHRLDEYYSLWIEKAEGIEKKAARIEYARKFNVTLMADNFAKIYTSILSSSKAQDQKVVDC